MLAEIGLDVLRYFDRPALEGLQMHSRYLRDIVNRHARTLPLRYIHQVYTAYGDVDIQLREDVCPVEVATPGEWDVEMLFHRLNNAFIRELSLRFCRAVAALLHHLRANVSDLQCQIGALQTRSSDEMIEHVLIDFIGLHLKPQTYATDMFYDLASGIDASTRLREDYAMLFTHPALRGNVKHLVYELSDTAAAPESIIPELFLVGAVETCAISTEVDPALWICKFIKTFEKVEPGTDTVRSVTLLHMDKEPLHHIPELLGQPRRNDVPTPHNTFIKECSYGLCIHKRRRPRPSIETCQIFIVENAKAAKKLEVLVWTSKEHVGILGEQMDPFNAFQLQVVDM